jgi:hypothetical protein
LELVQLADGIALPFAGTLFQTTPKMSVWRRSLVVITAYVNGIFVEVSVYAINLVKIIAGTGQARKNGFQK